VSAQPAAGLPADPFLLTPMAEWLGFESTGEPDLFRMRFAEHHIGNPFVRALHGGVVGAMIEASAAAGARNLAPEAASAELVASTVHYIRSTKDADLHCRVAVVRVARRVAFVDVWCWQDAEDTPVARGSCMLRLLKE